MSMYRPYSNVCFNNCYDFIMKSKAEKEAWEEISVSLTSDDEEEMRWELDRISDLAENIMNAEYDLCEMEMDALYDAMQYDSVFEGNAFRTSKRAQRRKQNIRHHKADRNHGKTVSQSDKKDWDEQSGTFYRWDEKKKTFSSPKKPVVHRKRKTFRDRLNSAMTARELDYVSNFSERGELMDKADFLDEAIRFGEREIENLEYEKTFGYLSDRGDTVIEECKRNLSELKDYKKDILRVIHTATR